MNNYQKQSIESDRIWPTIVKEMLEKLRKDLPHMKIEVMDDMIIITKKDDDA